MQIGSKASCYICKDCKITSSPFTFTLCFSFYNNQRLVGAMLLVARGLAGYGERYQRVSLI